MSKAAENLENDDSTSNEDEITSLDISDEEFNKLSFEEFISNEDQNSDSKSTDTNQSDADSNKDAEDDDDNEEGDTDDDDEGEDSDDTSNNDSDADDTANDNDSKSESKDEDSSSSNTEGDDDTKSKSSPFNGKKTKDKDKEKESSDDESEDSQGEESDSESNLNYKAEYEKLLAPFRANNKDMSVDSVDDARTLMQMGANYNKKMAGLKPNLKLIKMLDNNGLLDEKKLSFLIDLEKKDPKAITKFIKESGIDPLDIDVKSDSNYESKTYTVNDDEVVLDGILDEIKDTKSFNTTIDIIGNKWDEVSKKTLLQNPNVIKVINDHVEKGFYDKISTEVDKQRMLGKLNGVSDIDAYKLVGDKIQAAGGFGGQPGSGSKDTTNKEPSKKKGNKKSDSQLRSRKKAAGLTKPSSKKNSNEDYNPLSMSDEDFDKIATSKFM